MQLSAAVTEYLYSKDFTAASDRWYSQHLTISLGWMEAQHPGLQLEDLTVRHLREFFQHLRNDQSERIGRLVSSHTAHAYGRALKAFLHWCIAEGWLQPVVLKNFEMPRLAEKIVEPLTGDHIDRLMQAATTQAAHFAARDQAILAILIDTGVRASELVSLPLDKVTFAKDECYLTVVGKGRKERQVGCGKRSRLLLHRYIYRFRADFHPGPDEQKVFLAVGGLALTRDGLDQMLYRLRDKAGITGIRVSAHSFRHSYAIAYLKNGGDIYKLCRLMGHSKVAVTEEYLKAFRQQDARRGQSVLDAL